MLRGVTFFWVHIMADASTTLADFTEADLPDRMTKEDLVKNRYTEAALERHKREGLELAVKARWAALAVVAIMLPFLNAHPSVLYYHGLLAVLAANGWLQRRYGRVGKSRLELLLLFIDLSLMTFALVFPNPFDARTQPDATVYQYENFIYLFIILAGGTLAYSWRTIFAIGIWTALIWLGGAGLMSWFGRTDSEITRKLEEVFGAGNEFAFMMDPNFVSWELRVQEVVVFLIVAFTLGVCVRRFNRLILGNAALERERENLSRYFSPNVVEQLSQNDDPLKEIQSHNVAVLFVDIVGFTNYAADRHPAEVIATLRAFHGHMETEVFRHHGTLDKYLGDGLMATFGTPVATDRDAVNALACVRSMITVTEELNEDRRKAGEPEIRASFGLHYGPVVLGDIGANRLEYAVIGNTVNVASRLEALTRDLDVRLVASDDILRQASREEGEEVEILSGLTRMPPQDVRGLEKPVSVWSLT